MAAAPRPALRPAALAALAALAAAPACDARGPRAGAPTDPADALRPLAGGWEWLHLEAEDRAVRLERERWWFPGPPDGARLRGAYLREVTVVSQDGRPFVCNQQLRYSQRATFEVEAVVVDGAVRVRELGYRVEPSPCDAGLRHLGSYGVRRHRRALALRWDGGDQLLVRAPADAADAFAAAVAAPPERPPHEALSGRWRWRLTSLDRQHQARDEEERWELAVGADGVAGGTYVRTVTVRSLDGRPLPCAGAPRWRFVDRYTLRGRFADGALALEEVAVDAGDHPCLAPTPGRRLDTATAAVVGEHLEVTWRGARRQVLRR